MSFFSTLRRSSLFPQRFRASTSQSSSSSASSSLPNANPRHNPKWVSAFVLGSALSLLYYFSKPNSHFDSSSLSNAPHTSSPSFFRKLSLPESSDNLLFGSLIQLKDAYRSKVFFNYEKRIRLHSPPEKVFNLLLFKALFSLYIYYLFKNVNYGTHSLVQNRFHAFFSFSDVLCPANYVARVRLWVWEQGYGIFTIILHSWYGIQVFEYFASCRTPEGELLMKPADLMRAVVPVFPPSESNLVRDGYLKSERSPGQLCCPPSAFFMLFDVNRDELVSFREYMFFITLLSIPESSFSAVFKMFDKDNDGEIDREEFKKVMASMPSHNRQGVHRRDGRQTGLKAGVSVESGRLVEYLFGKDGKGRLGHDKFVQFIRDLHNEILRLEFVHYDFKSRNTISAKDFAHSIVASADVSHLGRLLKRVDELNNNPRFKNVRITFEEFKNFAELRKKLVPLSLALFSFSKVHGLLTRDDFQRAASSVCGLSLSDNVVEIVFHLFDSSGDGNLSSDEFVAVLHKRERGIAQPVETGILGFLSCCWN